MWEHFLIALALVAVTVTLWCAVAAVIKWRHERSVRRETPDPRVSVTLRAARAATELVPRFDPLIREGDRATVTIVGGPGTYATLSAKQLSIHGAELTDWREGLWARTLCKWLENGVVVDYLLAAPTDEGVESLSFFASKYPGRFNLTLLSLSAFESDEDKSMVGELATFHPCLLENATTGERAMWIENYHALDSVVATSVEYVAPRDARADSRFDGLKILLRRFAAGTGHYDDTSALVPARGAVALAV
jgi:hypothetical protein